MVWVAESIFKFHQSLCVHSDNDIQDELHKLYIITKKKTWLLHLLWGNLDTVFELKKMNLYSNMGWQFAHSIFFNGIAKETRLPAALTISFASWMQPIMNNVQM